MCARKKETLFLHQKREYDQDKFQLTKDKKLFCIGKRATLIASCMLEMFPTLVHVQDRPIILFDLQTMFTRYFFPVRGLLFELMTDLSRRIIKTFPIPLWTRNAESQRYVTRSLREAERLKTQDEGVMFLVFASEFNTKWLLELVSLLTQIGTRKSFLLLIFLAFVGVKVRNGFSQNTRDFVISGQFCQIRIKISKWVTQMSQKSVSIPVRWVILCSVCPGSWNFHSLENPFCLHQLVQFLESSSLRMSVQ